MKFEYGDGGRAASGRKGTTGDCVVRSICNVTGLPYLEVYEAIRIGNKTQRGRKARNMAQGIYTHRKWFKDYMKSLGFVWVPTVKAGQGCKTHLNELELPAGRLAVCLSDHYSSVINRVLVDTYDCSSGGTRLVYGYWILKENVNG